MKKMLVLALALSGLLAMSSVALAHNSSAYHVHTSNDSNGNLYQNEKVQTQDAIENSNELPKEKS